MTRWFLYQHFMEDDKWSQSKQNTGNCLTNLECFSVNIPDSWQRAVAYDTRCENLTALYFSCLLAAGSAINYLQCNDYVSVQSTFLWQSNFDLLNPCQS